MHFGWFRALSFAVAVLILNAASTIRATQILQGNVPREARTAKALGRVAADSELRLSIGLPLRNRFALTNLLEELYNPRSPKFRKFLTTDEFVERFGPSEEDYLAVADFIKQNGFAVLATHPNRTLLEFSGTVGQVENAFHIQLNWYQHPREARKYFAPDTEPSLDLKVPVLDISGLDDYILPKPANLVVKKHVLRTDARPMAGSGPGGSYLGWDFRAAYAPNVALNGSGQYVGLVQFDGYYPADIAAYVARVPGLTNIALTNVLLNGFDGTPGKNNVEVALDIEMTISMAPGLSAVLVYEGTSGNTILNRMATDNIAKQLSASWSFSINASTTQIFQQFAAQGQSYFNASGDDGAVVGTVPPPTDHPLITCVGGTTLSTRGPAAGWLSETVWSWYTTSSGTSASGGGISPSWGLPSWQEGIDMSTSHGSATMRNFPDVAMVADDVFVIADNGQQSSVGGTSVASPLWAGFMALVNQQAGLTGQPSVGFINPAVYSLLATTNYSAAFHDVRTGNNTNPASPTAFYAVAGYDLCTGVGTPTGKNLINALAPPPPYPVLVSAGSVLVLETCSPTNGAPDPGEAVIMRFSLQNFGGANTTNLVATLLDADGITSFSPPQSYGAIAQGATVSRQFTVIATGVCGSSATAQLQLQDGLSDLGTVAFPVLLGAPRSALAENFDGVAAPSLPPGWTRVATGGMSNWVTSIAARDTSPNAAFAFEPPIAGVCDLFSPSFAVNSQSARVTFRHSYNLEADPSDSSKAYDGGVLELKIGNTPSRDILVQGGSFSSGGYSRTILAADNPLNNRQAWSGNSGGFTTTTVNLPATAAGQNVQLRWRLGMNTGNQYAASGWYVDSIVVQDGYACCDVATDADIAVSQSVYPTPAVLGQSVAYTLTVRSLGPGPATGVSLANFIPANSAFVWGSPGYTNLGEAVAWDLGLMPLGRTTNLTLLVTPTGGTRLANVATVTSTSWDPDATNNTAVSVVDIATLPLLTLQPTNQAVVAGANIAFHAIATGTPPLTYQWRFQGSNLPGQTDSSLLLTNVQAPNAGAYSVKVMNPAGSVDSLTAILSVLLPPEIGISGVGVSGTNVSISLTSVNGFSYTLEYKDSLTDTDWLPLGPAAPGTGSIIVLQDTNAILPPIRFYRVNCQ